MISPIRTRPVVSLVPRSTTGYRMESLRDIATQPDGFENRITDAGPISSFAVLSKFATPRQAPGGTKSAPSPHQVEILRKCLVPSGMPDLIALSGRTDRTKYRNQVLNPLLAAKLVEMTIPDKPTSSRQQYRTTQAGRQFLEQLDHERNPS